MLEPATAAAAGRDRATTLAATRAELTMLRRKTPFVSTVRQLVRSTGGKKSTEKSTGPVLKEDMIAREERGETDPAGEGRRRHHARCRADENGDLITCINMFIPVSRELRTK